MSHRPQSAAVHIARRHQSAPSAHYADKAIQRAAVEIDEGRWFTPKTDEAALNNLGLALRNGSEEFLQSTPALEEFKRTRTLNEIAMHPAVMEAMDRMKDEIEKTTDVEELIERTAMLRETQEATTAKHRWEGQERWEGEENEEMRHGTVLSPEAFMKKLEAVIGRGRLLRGEAEVKTHALAKSGRVAIVIPNPEWTPTTRTAEAAQKESREVRDVAHALMLEVRSLRLLGRNAEADRKAKEAQERTIYAGGLLHEAKHLEATTPRRFVRVATLQYPLGTEWMVMGFDEFGVPTQPKYLGWRTALLTLIRRRLITIEEAHEAFPLSSTPAASWYLEQLQDFRHDGLALVN